jgi:hypothetical protein
MSVEFIQKLYVSKAIAIGTVEESMALDNFISWAQISTVREDDALESH